MSGNVAIPMRAFSGMSIMVKNWSPQGEGWALNRPPPPPHHHTRLLLINKKKKKEVVALVSSVGGDRTKKDYCVVVCVCVECTGDE